MTNQKTCLESSERCGDNPSNHAFWSWNPGPSINSSRQHFDRTDITLLTTRLRLWYKSTMATNNVGSQDSDVNKAPQIFTFNDLSENVCLAIAKFWVPEERLAYQRINQMVGICCNSLWIQQKKLPRRLRGDAYEKCCLRSPNLREIDIERMFIPDPGSLFETCPRIESFRGSLWSLINYVVIHKGQNCIKSINVTEFGRIFEEEIKSGMKLLAENLVHLKTMEWDSEMLYDDSLDASQEYLEALGRRASSITSPSYPELYRKFKPGSNLRKLDCVWLHDELSSPRELPERHPNLRALNYVYASLDSFKVLNGLQFLESVELKFDGNTIADNLLDMFRSFLSRHIHLKRLKLLYRGTQGSKQMVEDICRIRPTIESLSLLAGNLHIERDNIFPALLTLREFELKARQERGECFTFTQVIQVLASAWNWEKWPFSPFSAIPTPLKSKNWLLNTRLKAGSTLKNIRIERSNWYLIFLSLSLVNFSSELWGNYVNKNYLIK